MSAAVTPFSLVDAPLDQGTVLLEASAGTGKTYTITGLLVRMLLEDVVEHVEEALVVTFTVAAADELKNRLRAGIVKALKVCLGDAEAADGDEFFAGLARHGHAGAQKLRRALDEFDQASVMTIHGFCKRLLEESAFESDQPFELEFTVDEAPLLQTAAADALRAVRGYSAPLFGAVLQRAKVTPDHLVKLYRQWRRHPDTRLSPARPQVDAHLHELQIALQDAAARWDPELMGRIAGWKWNKTNGQGGATEHALVRALARFPEHPELALGGFLEFAARNLRERLLKASKPDADAPFFGACDAVADAFEATTDHLRVELLQRMEQRLKRIKQEQAVMTFDDMLEQSHEAVTTSDRREQLLTAVRARYSVGLIDEFQDTDSRQYEVLSAAFTDRPLFLVGDPKQSIYAFRGADLRTYLAAAGDAGMTRTLDTNYRSAQQLVQAVNHVFSRRDAFVEPQVEMHPVKAAAGASDKLLEEPLGGPPLQLRTFPIATGAKGQAKAHSATEYRARIAADVAAEIQRLLVCDAKLDAERLLPRNIAVLTRSNVEAELIQRHLRDVGVVSVVGKAGDVFETRELDELVRVLEAVLRPTDLMRARAALTTRIWGVDAKELVELDADEERLERELTRLDRWRQTWTYRGFVVMAEQALRELHVESRWLARGGGERHLTNLHQLCEMLHAAEHEHRLSPEALLEWLRRERAHKDSVEPERRELRLESDEDAVQVITMHGSKGLEYDVVFCPFLWSCKRAETKDVALPDPSTDRPAPRTLHLRTTRQDPAWQRAEADRLAEDVRLAYVALTRAKRRCYVHWAPISNDYKWSALAWLFDPTEPGERDGWQTQWGDDFHAAALSMYTDLDRFVEGAAGAIGVASVPDEAALQERGDSVTREPVPEGRHRPRPHRQPLAIHSFSSLVAGSEPGAHAHDVRDPAAPDAVVGEGIFGFARGADAGQCLHTILEHVDLDRVDADETRAVVDRTLLAHGLAEPGAHPTPVDPAAVVLQNLRDLAAARARADGPSVGELCRGDKLIEWQFTIPMGLPNLTALAAAFEQHGDAVARSYATRLRSLRPRDLRGYLTGFADLIAAHDGRYWVVDWKSNHLGGRLDDYGQSALRASMEHHDYVLQYHLYVLAWHRHLTARLPGYDYEQHFGGVCYAFLRGATPGTDNGMFHDRPPRALVEAMDRWAKEEA